MKVNTNSKSRLFYSNPTIFVQQTFSQITSEALANLAFICPLNQLSETVHVMQYTNKEVPVNS